MNEDTTIKNCIDAIDLLGFYASRNPAAVLAALVMVKTNAPRRWGRLVMLFTDYLFREAYG